ncbi:aldehyde dehydrogenase (NADP(+)) [Streptomyces sp. JJ36]|uniref:aldehyde dehydrogenase (NADP(+)) n=1 Tax=Streptomyces sp. JJ36 TaxID=2736645 RepID=UPI001F447339|nr:aldehyde dehydrogenase (NADP(+)) [Streptomyces sp. JJ36]MCF6523950.1 aldehyde dehydrogenase (NADP(+)) [Streptomyces sp. JJ36]
MTGAPVHQADPRTGEPGPRVTVEADAAGVDRAVRAAHTALRPMAERSVRAALLRRAAHLLTEAADEVIATADAETALGTGRLSGELARTTTQLTAFADTAEEGAFLDLRIDHADETRTPPRPDLRRMKLPLGVTAVYAASNFPLAFSVPGGDTASALAAGCPVVVKAHPGHPATSELCAALLRRAAAESGLPESVVTVVHGFGAGLALIAHPQIAAAGFTGSVRGGRALFDAAAARPVPIPFHGELGSLNPVVVTPAAAAERAADIAAGLAGSMTLGTGQFCTKPGLVLLPEGPDGDGLVDALSTAVGGAAPSVMLLPGMREAYLAETGTRAALPDVEVPVRPGTGEGMTVRAGVLTVPARRLTGGSGPHDRLLEECFGPVTVLARYADWEEALTVVAALPGSLTATAHLSAAEAGHEGGAGAGRGRELLDALVPLAGRVLVDGWPTGVAVTPAQQHGGPYPSSTSPHTSVGEAAVERWLRPVTYQSTPQALLPPELRDDNPLGLTRRVGGKPASER